MITSKFQWPLCCNGYQFLVHVCRQTFSTVLSSNLHTNSKLSLSHTYVFLNLKYMACAQFNETQELLNWTRVYSPLNNWAHSAHKHWRFMMCFVDINKYTRLNCPSPSNLLLKQSRSLFYQIVVTFWLWHHVLFVIWSNTILSNAIN